MRPSRKRLAAILLLSISGSGCTFIGGSVPSLPLPARPELTGISECFNRARADHYAVSFECAERIVVQDARLKAHIKKLENIILSTH